MKEIPKRRGLLVSALIVAMVIAIGLPVTGTSFAADPTPGTDADVGLSKEITANPNINEWVVTLTVNGNQKGRSSDVVIVMDRSRSMSYKDNTDMTRIDRAKSAAKRFVEQVLEAGSSTRIAVVTFDKSAKTVLPFTSSAGAIYSAIDGIDADYTGLPKSAGGTNLQAGIHMASELMLGAGGSTADLKSVMLISDGAPTHSFEFTGSVNASLKSCQIINGVHQPEWNDPAVVSSYNYFNTIGYGDSFLLTDHFVTDEDSCPEDGSSVHTFLYPENHGIPAVYEANQIKSKLNIYAIGIGLDSDAKDVLKDCKNAGYYDIKTTAPTYNFPFAAAIGSEAFQATVTDQIGNEFRLVTQSGISVSKGTASYDNNAITWSIPVLKPGDKAEMSYRIKAKSGIVFTNDNDNCYPIRGKHDTNEQAKISYKYPGGIDFSSDFIKPTVPLTGGAVILKAVEVNQYGQLLDPAGVATKVYSDAKVMQQGRYPINDPDSEHMKYMVYGNCQVSMGAVIMNGNTQYQFQGYACFNSDGTMGNSGEDPSDQAADVKLTPDNSIQTVYFKYLKEGTPRPPGQYEVRVRYFETVNGKNVSISPDKVYRATEGAIVTETALLFGDYTLIDSAHPVISLTVQKPTDENPGVNTIDFEYARSSEGFYNVKIRYLDGNGTSLAPDAIIENQEAGKVVSAGAINIKGYILNDSKVKTWTVIHSKTGNLITFTYKPEEVTSPPADNPGVNNGSSSGGGGVGGGGGGAIATEAVTAPPNLNKVDHFAYAIGYPDGEVKPLGTITREEVAVIFYRLMTAESRKQYYSVTQPFTDVSGGRWSNEEIATLYNAKIIQGNADGTFMPSKPITRAEFATIAAKFDKLEEPKENKFPDIDNHWAKKYINSSAEKGWINGYGDGTFRPDKTIIRCEAMKLINEVLDRRVNMAGLTQDTKQWPDNISDKWYYEIVLEATNTHDYERENRPKSTEKWTKIRDNPVW